MRTVSTKDCKLRSYRAPQAEFALYPLEMGLCEVSTGDLTDIGEEDAGITW